MTIEHKIKKVIKKDLTLKQKVEVAWTVERTGKVATGLKIAEYLTKNRF